MKEKIGLVGIDKNWIFDGFIGLVALGVIYLLRFLFPFFGVIGIPSLPASLVGDLGRALIIIICAPIFEEILFREFLLDFFDNKLFDAPFFVAALISSTLFALFHLAAYNSSLQAMQGSFFTAGFMGMVFAYIRKYTNSNMGNIVLHMGLNLIILIGLFGVVFVG